MSCIWSQARQAEDASWKICIYFINQNNWIIAIVRSKMLKLLQKYSMCTELLQPFRYLIELQKLESGMLKNILQSRIYRIHFRWIHPIELKLFIDQKWLSSLRTPPLTSEKCSDYHPSSSRSTNNKISFTDVGPGTWHTENWDIET